MTVAEPDTYWTDVIAEMAPADVVSLAASRIRFAMVNGVDGRLHLDLTATLLEQLAADMDAPETTEKA